MPSTSISITDEDFLAKIQLDSRFGWTDIARLGLSVARAGWTSVKKIEDEISTRERNIRKLQDRIAELTEKIAELETEKTLREVAENGKSADPVP